MTRRLRIDDLPALTIAESARDRRPTAPASPMCCAATTPTPTGRQLALAGGCRGHAPRRLTQGTTDTQPGVLAGRRDARVPARRPAVDPARRGRRGRRSARTCRSRPARRCGAPTAPASPSSPRSTSTPPTTRTDDDREQRGRRPDRDRRRRLPGRRHAASSAACGCSCTCSTSSPATSASSRMPTPTSSSPAWSPDGSRLAFIGEARWASTTSTCAPRVHVIDPADPRRAAEARRVRRRLRGTVALRPRRRHARRRRAGQGEPTGIARLYRRRRSATGRDASSSRRPSTATSCPARRRTPAASRSSPPTGDVLFAVRDRGCTHLYAVPLDGGEPRLVHGGDGNVVSGLSVAGTSAAIALATPTSFGEIVLVDLASGDEQALTAHGSAPDDVELFVRESREFAISDGVTVQGWLSATPRSRGRDRRCSSTSTADRTTRGTAPPTTCTCTTRSSSPAAGPCCMRQPARQRRLRRGRSTPPSSERGARPTPRTSSSRSTSSSPRASPTRSASRSPATATAAS